jgi:hypothetical protein
MFYIEKWPEDNCQSRGMNGHRCRKQTPGEEDFYEHELFVYPFVGR